MYHSGFTCRVGHIPVRGGRQLGRKWCFQYVRLPIVHGESSNGRALVAYGRVDEHDVVLSPSNCGQEIRKIAIAGDEDDCGWR